MAMQHMLVEGLGLLRALCCTLPATAMSVSQGPSHRLGELWASCSQKAISKHAAVLERNRSAVSLLLKY